MSLPYRYTGLGSVFKGARWTVKGLMPTIYASTDPATLSAELHYKGLRYGWTITDFTNQLIIGMRWELQAVMNLTDAATLAALNVTNAEVNACDWDAEQSAGREPLTQAIARASFEKGAEGLIVPSARRPGGVNIVYFPCHRRDGTLIRALNEAGVPFTHGL